MWFGCIRIVVWLGVVCWWLILLHVYEWFVWLTLRVLCFVVGVCIILWVFGGWVCWRCVFVLELIVCLLIVLGTIRLLMVEFTVCCSVVLV